MLYLAVATVCACAVYVIDSGISAAMTEVASVQVIYTALADGVDCNGHGTRTAALIGSPTYGVAKDANVYALRVLDCTASGTLSNTIAALDHASSVITNASSALRSIINLSVASPLSSSLNAAVQFLLDMGVIVVAAAGNLGSDACLQSPSSVQGAVTVAAIDAANTVASFSNEGACIDLFAPGVAIPAPDIASPPTGNTSASGTSFSTPLVTGLIARLLQQMAPTAKSSSSSGVTTTDDVIATLLCQATTGLVLNRAMSNSANLIAYLPALGATVTMS